MRPSRTRRGLPVFMKRLSLIAVLLGMAATPASALSIFAGSGFLAPNDHYELVTVSGGSMGQVDRIIPTRELGFLTPAGANLALGVFVAMVSFSDGSGD